MRSFAQTTDTTINKTRGQHSIYAEAFGSVGIGYTIGYDYTLKLKDKNKLSFGSGFQCLPILYSSTNISFAPHISYLYGYNHHLEVGTGFSYNMELRNNPIYTRDYWVIPFSIGYRYQRENGGWFFKIAFIQAFTNFSLWGEQEWGFMPCWGGIAIGYTFKNKVN